MRESPQLKQEHPYNIWARVGLFGMRVKYGYVTLYQTYGEPPDICWLKIEEPQKGTTELKPSFYNPQAVFSIDPLTEEEVRDRLRVDMIEPDELPF